ncbi:hypothetical protein [Clostridium gasigenes]|uniref:hypothetical protein n=1 Tax=Clostridium gasigenes TaxID=94869 RepID=UPI001C0C20B3|nr:hypothetical protein [Clostridium gasigenes]MBU3108307.1 hypothetical protein [Clostridium gasigenes]
MIIGNIIDVELTIKNIEHKTKLDIEEIKVVINVRIEKKGIKVGSFKKITSNTYIRDRLLNIA